MSDSIGKSVYSDLKIFYHAEKISDMLNGKRTAPIYVKATIDPMDKSIPAIRIAIIVDQRMTMYQKIEPLIGKP